MATRRTPAIDLLRRERVDHRIHEYTPAERRGRARDARPDYGAEAAAALGVDPARMFKTLIVVADGRLAAALVPVHRQLDRKRLAAVLGVRAVALADPIAAERAAGSVVGAISPLAMRRPLRLVVDASVETQATVYVSAGRRGLQIEITPRDLVRLGTANMADIAG